MPLVCFRTMRDNRRRRSCPRRQKRRLKGREPKSKDASGVSANDRNLRFPRLCRPPSKQWETHYFFGPIEPLGLVKALACAGSLGQDMTEQDTRQDLGSAGLSAAIITTH